MTSEWEFATREVVAHLWAYIERKAQCLIEGWVVEILGHDAPEPILVVEYSSLLLESLYDVGLFVAYVDKCLDTS